jgi:hypothetical protein
MEVWRIAMNNGPDGLVCDEEQPLASYPDYHMPVSVDDGTGRACVGCGKELLYGHSFCGGCRDKVVRGLRLSQIQRHSWL